MYWVLAIAISLSILIWAFIERSKTQRVMQWWFEQQLVVLEQQSNHIHDGPMQDLFVVRRSMELANTNFQSSGMTEQGTLGGESLYYIEKIYAALEQLSYNLSPAYIAESLPLAIQARLKQWESSHSQIIFILNIPDTWQPSSAYQDYLVVQVLDEVLKLTFLSVCSVGRLQVELGAHSPYGSLNIRLGYVAVESLRTVLPFKDLDYLRRSFELLSNGKCSYRTEGQELLVDLQWRI